MGQLKIIFSGIFLFILLCLSIVVGASATGFFELINLIGSNTTDDSTLYIFQYLRFPRTMTLIFVGASLGLSGSLLQTLLENPLAEPYTLGLSGGASLGAIVGIALELQPFWLFTPLLAFVGCMLATIFVLDFPRAPLFALLVHSYWLA